MEGRAPSEIASHLSLLHKVVIYAKEGSAKLLDGRWNLSQSEAKLGIALTPDQTDQLKACIGEIVCTTPGVHNEDEDTLGSRITATAVSVLRPDLLVTAKHVFFKSKRAVVPFGSCSFRSFSNKKVAIPVVVERDQRKGYVFNNEDFMVLRLKRPLAGCNPFAITDSDLFLREGERLLSVTGAQANILNKVSRREPVVAAGSVRSVFNGFFGGPPFYYADIDFDVGGSGGAVFALADGRPVADDGGRLVLRGISVGYGPHAKNGKPYSQERNYTIVIGLQADFRDLVKGKANQPGAVDQAACPAGGEAKISVISAPIAQTGDEALGSSLQKYACSRKAAPGRKAGARNLDCMEVTRGVKLASARRGKQKQEFRLKNDTSCRICFTYNRCNNYGCWDEAVNLGGQSLIFAGVREQAPLIRDPQFCKPSADMADGSESLFLAAQEKAKRQGVETLTAEDIRGLSLEQIRTLRGY